MVIRNDEYLKNLSDILHKTRMFVSINSINTYTNGQQFLCEGASNTCSSAEGWKMEDDKSGR